jgi:hypothetical protein
MRIVRNLDNITECPNCTSGRLISTTNEFGRPFKQCVICAEEIFENETTCSEEQYPANYPTKVLGTNEAVEWQKQKKKDNFIFEMREEINHLTWSIHDAHTMVLVGNIQNILNRIIDYIEEN